MTTEKNTDEEVNLLTLSGAAKIAGFTPEYLNMLARQKKLQALKIGRNWFTTQEWLNNFFHPELKTSNPISEEKEVKTDSEINAIQELVNSEKKSVANHEDRLLQRHPVMWWQSMRVFSLTVIIILVFFGTLQTIKVKQNMENDSGLINQTPMEIEKIETLDVAEQDGKVLGTQTDNIGRVLLASENYAIKEIKFGGDVSLLASSYENFPLKLTDVRSQIVTTKGKDEFQLLVYWKTNKLAISSIAYSKMGADTPRKISEDDFGFSHSVIIPKLDPATAYTYVITAKDKWGNTITSDRYSAYTGAKNVSVFDLIVNAAEDTFGWAMKK
jgi:hypothetical protein